MTYPVVIAEEFFGIRYGANKSVDPDRLFRSIEGQELVIATQYMAAIPEGELRSGVGSLAEKQDEISAALDMLFLDF